MAHGVGLKDPVAAAVANLEQFPARPQLAVLLQFVAKGGGSGGSLLIEEGFETGDTDFQVTIELIKNAGLHGVIGACTEDQQHDEEGGQVPQSKAQTNGQPGGVHIKPRQSGNQSL